MKQLFLLLTILVLSTASPKPYFRQQYQYQEHSEAYKNDELQHKKDKAERYSKVQEGSSAPLEHSSVHQSEYHAPGSEDQLQTKSGNSQNYQQQGSFNRNWDQQSGYSQSLTDQDLASQTRKLQTTGLRSLPESTGAGGHSSYSKWSSHSSYSYGQTPDSTMNHGYRQPNYDGLQTSQTQSQSLSSQTQQERQKGYANSYFAQNKQDEVGRLQSGSQNFDHDRVQGHGYRQMNHGTNRQLNTDDQTTSNQRSKTYFLTSSNADTAGVRIVPSTQTGTVAQRRTYTSSQNIANQQSPNLDDTFNTFPQPVVPSLPSSDHSTVTHQTRRTYTASQSSSKQTPNTDAAPIKPLGVIVPSSDIDTRSTYTASHINRQAQNVGSTYNIDAAPQKPFGVVVPSSDIGTIGQQTRSTYTASHINRQAQNVGSTYNIDAQKPLGVVVPSSDIGTIGQQTRNTYTASHINRQAQNVGSTYNIDAQKPLGVVVPSADIGTVNQQTRRTYTSSHINSQSPAESTVPVKPSEVGTVTQQRRIYSASHVNQQSPNVDSTFHVPHTPSGVPLAPFPSSDVGTVTHQRRTYTSQSSTINKQSPNIDDTFNAKPIPQQISGVPVISFPSSDSGTVIHQTGRTLNTQTNSETLQTAVKPVSTYPGYIRIIPRTTTEQPDIIEAEEPIINNDKLKKSFEEQPLRNPVGNQQSTHQTRTMHQSSAFSRTHSTTNEQNQQKTEDINQQNHDLNQKNLDYHLTQQTQDGFDSLEVGSQRRDDSEELTQQEVHEFEDQQTQHYKPAQNKPQYQPAQNTPQYQPTQNKPQYQPTQNKPLYQPAHNKPEYQPAQNSPQYQPAQNTPQYQPAQNTPQYQSRPTTNAQQEASYTSRQTQRTYQAQRVEKTEFADIPQQSTTQKPVRAQTQQRKDLDYDDYESTDRPQTHDLETDDLTQQHEEVSNEDFTQQRRYEFNQQTQNNYGGRTQHRDITPTFNTQKHDYGQRISQNIDSLGRTIPKENLDQGTSYVRTNSYSSSNSYSQQQPQAVFSPVHVGSTAPGQFRVYQTMQIPAGTSAETRTKLEEQMRQQLQQKMQELQSQQQSSHSSHVSYSPIHFGTNSGTGEFQVYQTMQIPAGATEEMRQRLQEQMRQQLEQKMQELLQQRSSSSYQQINVKPVVVHSYGGEAVGADCDDETGAAYSSSYSSSSSSSMSGASGGNHYKMQLRPGSSHSISQNMQIPSGYHHY